MHSKKIFFALLLVVFSLFLATLFTLPSGNDNFPEEIIKEPAKLQIICPKLNTCGDSFLLINHQHSVLIDTGESSDFNTIFQLLKHCGVRELDALILTHYDKDHIGGAAKLLDRIPVGTCYMPVGSEDSAEYKALLDSLDRNDVKTILVMKKLDFRVSHTSFTLYPSLTYEYEKNTDNNRSILTKVEIGKHALLFAGDAQKERMQEFFEKQYDDTAYELLKIPHHGRDPKVLKNILKHFTPSYAVLTSSKAEPESDELMALLKETGIETSLTREETASFVMSLDQEESKSTDSQQNEMDQKNGNPENQTNIDPPEFSREGGFYEKGFSLTLKAPEGCTIYYTLDSSTPSESSTPYKEAISIKDLSNQPNHYSANKDLCPFLFKPILPEEEPVYPGLYPRRLFPEGLVDKCAVVRAIAVDKNGHKSKVKTASYFIGFDQKKGYENTEIVSIVTDPDGLFSPDHGIMVNGQTYMDKIKSGEINKKSDIYDVRFFTNSFTATGRESERETEFTLYGEDRQNIFSQTLGLRLHGNQSRLTQNQKSFNLYARKEYDGNNVITTPLFGDGILLDTISMIRGDAIRNYYLPSRLDHRTMDAQNYRLVQVFLDGEYWGLYAIQERFNSSQYMKTHYGVGNDDFSVITEKIGKLQVKEGNPLNSISSFVLLKDYVVNTDLSKDSNYKILKKMMDIQSFIDVYATKVYLGDSDWTWKRNLYLSEFDHKWHWMIFDLDRTAQSWENRDAKVNDFTEKRIDKTNMNDDPFFPALMKNDDFRRDFIHTYMDLANEVFNAQDVHAELQEISEKYLSASQIYMKRYPSRKESTEEHLAAGTSILTSTCDTISDYLEKRYEYGPKILKDYFHLKTDLQTVTIINKEEEAGTITLNTITPTLSVDGSWSGLYFRDYPISVTAKPKEGYEFVAWSCKGGSVKNAKKLHTKIYIKGPTTITAVFRKIPERNQIAEDPSK